ncbi:hypothetical protein SAMN05421796_11089 [Chryseobacterium piscicola]|jgi:hypothetical protein|uniref:Uncharacterized protein n=1 Tax=Chryseobacterium piscicola TaxID=551459 RepID=A0A1N7P1U6_9FLAO|nr:hypothetical protein B0A70_10100 [Chryseobacterium piscicola]SIT04528.1 hypothetical protein SAMN05421796_11089 [Chryseobacterium piscicola]
MYFFDCFIVVLLMLIFNSATYIIFKKYLYRKDDAAMKFLTLNITKDLVWLVISLLIISKTKENFLLLVVCFIISSFIIYLSVIKLINKL